MKDVLVASARKGVEEIVEMPAFDDVDAERTPEARELFGTRIRNHHDRQGRGAASHASRVLQHEAALEPFERTHDMVDGHVSGRALGGRARRQHVSASRGIQIAAEFLGEQKAPEQGISRHLCICQRLDADIETSGGTLHLASDNLKCRFSMMPTTLPQGSSTSATRMPSPTSWISVRG